MPTTTNDNIESLSLTLKTPESAADAAAVASMLRAIVVLVDETKRELGAETEIAIRVRPFTEGSLEIPFDLIVYGAGALLGFNAMVSQILKTIQQVVDLRKSLKGTPSAAASTESLRHDAASPAFTRSTVANINQNPRVNSALHQAFVDLDNDKEITGVRVVDETTGEELVSVDREEFAYFRTPAATLSENPPLERTRKVTTTLTIHTPVLQGPKKWTFIYEGLQISVSIKDQIFLAQVAGGVEAFRNGDRLSVDLEIGEKFVPAIAEYERTKRYAITKVHEHIPRPLPPVQTIFKFPDAPEAKSPEEQEGTK
ncbi:hypothetical protein [Planctomicrobium sp. SH527]|uniref:hypothetical protein n=1 Tax=Planctomicrobium sp. SH527 TaxID=3448123 RepID=UPI003F5BFDC6